MDFPKIRSKCGFVHGYFSFFECNVTWYYHYFHPTPIFWSKTCKLRLMFPSQKKKRKKNHVSKDLGGTNMFFLVRNPIPRKAESEPKWDCEALRREKYGWWKKFCTSWYGKYPIIYRVSSCSTWHVWNPVNNGIITISDGAEFLPSTVCLKKLLLLHLGGPIISKWPWVSRPAIGSWKILQSSYLGSCIKTLEKRSGVFEGWGRVPFTMPVELGGHNMTYWGRIDKANTPQPPFFKNCKNFEKQQLHPTPQDLKVSDPLKEAKAMLGG